MNADTAIDRTANRVASTSMARIGANAPRFTGSLQRASSVECRAMAPPAYGRGCGARKCGQTRSSPRRRHPHERADEMVAGVAPRRLVEVGQQLEDELHQRGSGQPVPGGRLHEPRVADEAHEQAADREVGPEATLDRGAVGGKPAAV